MELWRITVELMCSGQPISMSLHPDAYQTFLQWMAGTVDNRTLGDTMMDTAARAGFTPNPTIYEFLERIGGVCFQKT